MSSLKLLFVVAVTGLVFTSCKKSYTCSCYEPWEYNDYEIKAGSKEEAADACKSYDEPVWRTCTLTEGYWKKKEKKK